VALTREYRDGRLIERGFPISEVSEFLEDDDATVWFDLCRPTAEELGSISEELGLHPLAVEDAQHPHQRPKLDRYPSHVFLTAYALHLDPASGALDYAEVDAFITHNALVTVRRSENFPIDEVLKRWDNQPELARYGVGYLVHGLLDYVVDTHFEAVQAMDNEIETIEEGIFADRPQDRATQVHTFELRKSLVELRRVVLPMRELVNSMIRRDVKLINDELFPYYQDIYDHVLRATEWTDSLRDLLTNIFETALTMRSNRLNVITKQVTSWAAIIAVPTAVTGWFGQNIGFPGKDDLVGLLASSVLILGLSGGLYLAFKRKDWI
jgi:magnesium transporter